MGGGQQSGVDVGARVALALGTSSRTEQLMGALAAAGFDVAPVNGIAAVAELVPAGESAVAIVDDVEPQWLGRLSDLVRARPQVRVLALVEITTADEFLSALIAGAVGVVSPTADADAVVRSVTALRDGGVAVPRSMVTALVDVVRHGRGRSVQTSAGPIDVTEREWEILQLLLQRRSTREMAELLYVSVGTVRSHISVLLKKLGAVDREDAIRMVERGSS